MTRGKFLALLGLVPVAIKAAVTKTVEPKPVEQAPNLGHWMSDGTGCSSFDPINYHGELRWQTVDLQQRIVERVARENPYMALFRTDKFPPLT